VVNFELCELWGREANTTLGSESLRARNSIPVNKGKRCSAPSPIMRFAINISEDIRRQNKTAIVLAR
jgi:hypothetical protein